MKGIDNRTVEGKLQEMLYKRGLFEDQAAAVMDRLKQSAAMEVMQGRWRDSVDDFPPSIMTVLWLAVRDEAAEWIKENCPKHWARPLFARKEASE